MVQSDLGSDSDYHLLVVSLGKFLNRFMPHFLDIKWASTIFPSWGCEN